jgi:hypothetical protein
MTLALVADSGQIPVGNLPPAISEREPFALMLCIDAAPSRILSKMSILSCRKRQTSTRNTILFYTPTHSGSSRATGVLTPL